MCFFCVCDNATDSVAVRFLFQWACLDKTPYNCGFPLPQNSKPFGFRKNSQWLNVKFVGFEMSTAIEFKIQSMPFCLSI